MQTRISAVLSRLLSEPNLTCGEQAPGQPKQEEEVAPVIDIDLEALQGLHECRAPNRNGGVLPGRLHEHQSPSDKPGSTHQSQKGDSSQPTIVEERVYESVVRFGLGNDLAEFQRTEAVWIFGQKRDRPNLFAEAAIDSDVIFLAERKPVKKGLPDIFE